MDKSVQNPMIVRKAEGKATQNGLTGEEMLSFEVHISVWEVFILKLETNKIASNNSLYT